ncbi:hypothetical protein C8A00DRAFT_47172 [Chaetomidium leptoderma]|uniref:F-box domain-containing protein n=1 Tax=Chaetomidium leptoderma TaxID=669021 RepID=A0AAN6VD37_9PEZI|nr:hypothetical protein C8A00DRAFT_47172 [Chaetomidium leptoderma]
MTMRQTQRTGGFLARSGPAEIILYILQWCHSTQDLLALVSTCRHVCHVWRGNVAAALWPVWLREIPHFRDAVMAARMTQLVVDAERRGELPPTRISPRQLQQDREQPTLSDLKAAFGLHRLSRAIATWLCDQDLTYPSDRRGHQATPEDPARTPEWTARVSHAVFRVLIVGAALAGAYKEPLFKAMEHPDPEIKALPGRVPRDYRYFPYKGENGLGEKELAFLLQFAVCDLDATLEAQDAVFGPIADWLLESILSDQESRQAMAKRFEQRRGRAGFCISQEEEGHCPVGFAADGSGSHSDAHLVVWELMKMFWIVEQVRPYGLQERVLDRRTPCPPSTPPDVGANQNSRGPPGSVVAVFFGMFRAEKTMLPTTPVASPWWQFPTYPAVPETEEAGRGDGKLPGGCMSVAVFFDWIFEHSGRPNHIDVHEEPVAPLELKFFEYFLQRHLGLCLDHQAFREDELEFMERSFQEFVGTITIFSHDDVENRRSYEYWAGTLDDADFLDGSELLRKHPPNFTRFYKRRLS